MKIYEIDFKGVKKSEELFERIIESLNFPSWCGKNLDAIWDMVTWEIDTPAVISLRGLNSLTQEVYTKTEQLLKVFNDAHDWYEDVGEHLEIHIED